MKKLVIATQNQDKFREMREVLEGLDWEILPAFEFPGAPEVVEDGETLEENSLKKAKVLCEFTGLPALADDTGLFVEALGGQPGIYAARFAGKNATYADNVNKTLALMMNVPKENRKALFKTVITIYYPDKKENQVSGEVHGVIVEKSRGSVGFGYDPIFLPRGQSRVFAEMSLEEKNLISHRGKAVRKAREILARP